MSAAIGRLANLEEGAFLGVDDNEMKQIFIVGELLVMLEEIAVAGKESSMEAGGEELRYIPALNDSNLQIELLCNLVHHEFNDLAG